MRFNPKADISGGRVRERGGSGGGGLGGGGLGGGGGRIPIPGGRAGGGIGAVLLVIAVLVISSLMNGTNSSNNATDPAAGGGAGSDRYEECKTGADANESADCARLAVETSLGAYWEQTLPEQSDAAFEDTTINTFSGQISTACGAASSAVGPFYCPADKQIYLDTTFFADVLEGQLGGQGGDFVEPYVLAHEYGHHIQNLMGTMGRVRTQQGPTSDAVRLELQADCYAGMWTGAATATQDDSGVAIFESVDEGDISEAIDAAKTVGDDRIQSKSGGGVNPEAWTHGSSEQRMRWFEIGRSKGTLAACDTFSASRL